MSKHKEKRSARNKGRYAEQRNRTARNKAKKQSKRNKRKEHIAYIRDLKGFRIVKRDGKYSGWRNNNDTITGMVTRDAYDTSGEAYRALRKMGIPAKWITKTAVNL